MTQEAQSSPEATPPKKKNSSRQLMAQFIAIMALTISIFLIVDLGRRAASNYRIQREAERLSLEVEIAEAYQQELLAQRDQVASDSYVEEVARRELKWARPGESIVIVLPTPEASAQQPTANPQIITIGPTASTPAEAWWQLFFGEDASPRYTRSELSPSFDNSPRAD